MLTMREYKVIKVAINSMYSVMTTEPASGRNILMIPRESVVNLLEEMLDGAPSSADVSDFMSDLKKAMEPKT